MSIGRLLLAAIALLPAACAGSAPIDVAQLRPGELGSGAADPDVAALTEAQSAFEDSRRTYGHPAAAARASAALDYLAGAMSVNPRWGVVSATTKAELLQGRDELRQALGVVPGTPSQVVVDRLSAASEALGAGNQQAAIAQLGPPAFNAPGPVILARLADLPYLRMANIATEHAADEVFEVTSQPEVNGLVREPGF